VWPLAPAGLGAPADGTGFDFLTLTGYGRIKTVHQFIDS
jgi:hypothetical protein